VKCKVPHAMKYKKNPFYKVNRTESALFKVTVHAKMMLFQTFVTFFCGSHKRRYFGWV